MFPKRMSYVYLKLDLVSRYIRKTNLQHLFTEGRRTQDVKNQKDPNTGHKKKDPNKDDQTKVKPRAKLNLTISPQNRLFVPLYK
jgi:hypothetical protein